MNGRPLPPMILCLEAVGRPYRLWLEPLSRYFQLIEGDGREVALGDVPFFVFGVGGGCEAAQVYAGDSHRRVAGLLLCAPAGQPELEQCEGINAPTLILAGRRDPSAQAAEQFHALLPNSRLVIFDGSGRFPFADEPQNFERVIRDWLAIL